jgi:hypothetical protein
MKLRRQYQTAEEIPTEARGFYTEREGVWELDVEEKDEGRRENEECPLTPAYSPRWG